MEAIPTETLILSLIQDSLINFKLISGLNALGLNADDYHVYLGDTIFKLMELENHAHSDLIFEKVFLANAKKIKHVRFPASTDELEELSEDIYQQLLFARDVLME